MVIGDSMIRNVGSEQAKMSVECFPGIKTELHRVIDKADLGSPKNVIFHVETVVQPHVVANQSLLNQPFPTISGYFSEERSSGKDVFFLRWLHNGLLPG